MKNDKRMIAYIIYAVLGLTLMVRGVFEVVDAFWSGMGGGLIAVAVMRMIQYARLRKNDEYRKQKQIETTDERNRFIRNKAWACAGYLFVLIAAISTIVLKLLGQEMLSIAAGFAVCILTLLYWVCFTILRKKY